jgi:hypothetical protein
MKIRTNITKTAFKAACLLTLCAGFAGCGTGADNQLAIFNSNLDNISATDDGNFAKPVALMSSAAIPTTAVGADTASSATQVADAEVEAASVIDPSRTSEYMVIDEPTPYPLPGCRGKVEIKGRFYAQMDVQMMPLPYTPESKCYQRIYTATPLPLPNTDRHPIGMTDLNVVN